MLNFSKQTIGTIAAQDKFYSLRAIKSPQAGRILAKFLMVILAIFLMVLFCPWQQNIRGSGKVTALNPMNRPQTIQTIIAGQIRKWHVVEGQYVQKGDTIISISEVKDKYFDPQLLSRVKEQIDAKNSSITAKEEKANALKRQIDALTQAMENKIEQARLKLEAEKIKYENAQNQFQRNKRLYEAGNIPLTKLQEIEYKFQGSQADFLNSQIEVNRIKSEYLEKISKSESDLSSTQSELFESQAEVSKLRNEFSNIHIRNQQYEILSPQNGYVVKVVMAGIGETVKEGEPVCTIMPAASDMAVEMYVKAMDVPLISKSRKVRIQFDGWPALQFSGWPSASVGTFGGQVEVIDYVNSKPGEFRILVIPDRHDQEWPRQLRVGSGIKGWVMLDNVPVWYEIWRQLNGFPPSLYAEPFNGMPEKESKAKSSS